MVIGMIDSTTELPRARVCPPCTQDCGQGRRCERIAHLPGLPAYLLALCVALCAMVGAAVVLA